MMWDEMMTELRKEYPDVIGKSERIAKQLDGHISKLDAYEVLTKCYNHRLEVQHEALREALSRVPVADVAPVVHGRWILTDFPDECTYKCSECNEYWVFLDGTPTDNGANYCPNCGAAMDLEE